MHLLILPYLDCSDSHAYTISLELCAGFNDSTHKTSLLHFESVILYAPLHKDKLRTTAGDRGGAGLFSKIQAKFATCWKKTAIFVKFQQKNCKCRKICKILSNKPAPPRSPAVVRSLSLWRGAYRITYSKYSNDVL